MRKKPRRVRGPQVANQVKSIFRGGIPQGTSAGRVRHEKYFARRECARMGLKDHSDARFGANDFLFQKSIALLEQD